METIRSMPPKSDAAAGESTYKHKYEQIPGSIGQPRLVQWTGAWVAGWLSLVLGVVTLACWWWAESPVGFGWDALLPIFLSLPLAISSIIVLLIWLVLYCRVWTQQKWELARLQKVMDATEEDPGFLSFYYHALPVGQAPSGTDPEEIARSVGRPGQPHWIGVWIAVGCAFLFVLVALIMPWCYSFFPEWFFATYGHPWGYEYTHWTSGVDTAIMLALLSIAAWLWLYWRGRQNFEREALRREVVAEAVAANPGFLPFYKRWCLSGHYKA